MRKKVNPYVLFENADPKGRDLGPCRSDLTPESFRFNYQNPKRGRYLYFLLIPFFIFLGDPMGLQIGNAISLEKGEKLFNNNCIVCHAGGNNIIIPEKNLKKETLEANGMNTKTAIAYQVLNGKNGMPAFGGRLKENEIEAVATYVLEQSNRNLLVQKSNF